MSEIYPSKNEDIPAIKILLKKSDLSTEDITSPALTFITAKRNEEIIGTAAIEVYDHSCVFRSFAVLPEFRNQGIGKPLYNSILELAVKSGFINLYLLTITAETYFLHNGRSKINRNQPNLFSFVQLLLFV